MPTANIVYGAMAAYNGGWTGYTQTSAYFGVSYSAYMAVAIRFTAPSYSGIPSSLTIQVPVALHWSDDSGAMPCYYSLTKTDPTTLGTVYAASSPGTDSGRIASGTASITGSTSSVFYWTFTISLSALTSGGTYYLVLGANGTSYNAYAEKNKEFLRGVFRPWNYHGRDAPFCVTVNSGEYAVGRFHSCVAMKPKEYIREAASTRHH